MTAKQTRKDQPEDSSKEDKDKVFDVSKPGHSEAEPNSKPVIVKRNMIKKDPTMATGDSEEEPKEEQESKDKKQEMKDKPVEVKVNPKKKDPKEDKPKEEQTDTRDSITEESDQDDSSTKDEQAEEEQPTQSNDDSQDPKAGDQDSTKEGASSKSGEVEALAGEADSKMAARHNEQATKEAEARQKLIDSKQYYLNIGEIKRRRMTVKLISILIIVLVLSAAGYLLAADGGIIDGPIKPVTDIL